MKQKVTSLIGRLKAEKAGLRSRCEELEKERDTARQSLRELYAESYDLSQQLASARNDALDEAITALDQVREPIAGIADHPWSGSAYRESFRLWQVRNLIEALKS